MKTLSYFLAALGGAAPAAVAFLLVQPTAKDALGSAQAKQVEAVVESVLMSHPELIAKAIEQLQERQQAEQADQQRSAVKAKAAALFDDPADPVLGDPQGDVTVVEFFDYRCPYCKRAMPGIMETLEADGHIRLVLKEFPILGPNSLAATRAALAAVKQAKYEPFHTALLGSNSALDEGAIFALAETARLDVKRLADDMKDPAIDAQIKKVRALAEELKIEGTPAFIIGDRLVPGAIDRATFQQLVQDVRKKG